MKKVAIIMGSDSDLPVVEKGISVLKEYGVPFEVHVYSAHRTPEEAAQLMPLYVLSDVAETEPWGFEAETKFLNMVLSVKTLKEPLEILDICQNIERVLGRDRAAEGPRYDNEGRRIYHSRLIDIDLLYCEEALGRGRWREIRMEHPRLQLPHPKLPERAFAQELLRNVIVKENHKFV